MKYRITMSTLVILAASLYFPLNQNLLGGFNLSTRFDPWIPLWPIWVIPYLLCLPFWAGGLIWAVFKMNEQLFKSFITASLFVLLTATTFYYFFPTYVLRPTLTNNDWATTVLNFVYLHDGTYNAFPSGHVYQTTLLCLFYNRLYPNHPWVWVDTILIVVLATLFTHQHNLLDPIGGFTLALIGYRLGIYIYPQKSGIKINILGEQNAANTAS